MSDWQEVFATLVQPAVGRAKYLKHLDVGPGALARTGTLLREHFEGDALIVFADEAGFDAAGDGLIASARAAGYAVRTHVIAAHPRPKPSAELAASFEPLIADGAIPVSVGSGVMNDLVKYAAFRRQKPYCAVATAASMDGYASAGAPLSQNGFKITLPARCPRLIIADLDVISAAPAEMAGWGYGDLAGKVPAGADWILADALGIEPIDPKIWPLVQGQLRDWLADPVAVKTGDFGAISKLFAGLIMTGLAMEFHGTSRPASGADHQIAHLWEMQGLSHAGERVSHGACVSIGTISVLSLYQWLLTQDLTRLDIAQIVGAAPDLDARFAEIDRRIPDSRIAERARKETAAKHLDKDQLKARLEKLAEAWPDLRQRLTAQLLPAADIARLLKAAGAPVVPADIGVSEAERRLAIYASRFLRSRYTVLDLLDEAGLLDAAIASAFPG